MTISIPMWLVYLMGIAVIVSIIENILKIYLRWLKKKLIKYKTEAEEACIDIHFDIHISELKYQPEHIKNAWHVGRKLYYDRYEK